MLNRLPGNRLQPLGKQRGEGNLFLHLGWLRPDRVRRLSIILIGLATVLCAQADDEEEPIEPEAAKLHRPVDFNRDIAPILEAGCIACHNKTIQESDLILEDVAGIVKGGVSGPAVLPGKPLESLLFLAAARKDEPFMPPMPNDVQAKPLTPKQLGLIRLWIQEGAKAGMGGTGREVNWKPIPSHLKAIYSVALSPWARFAAAGRTNRIAIYDLAAATQTTALHDPNLLSIKSDDEPMYGADAAHRDFVHSLAFGPSGRLLASGGYRTVKLWRRPTNIRRIQFDSGAPVTTIALSPDQTLAALAAEDDNIRLWNVTDGSAGTTLSGHTAVVTGLQFTPDGSRLVSSSHDKSIRLWNLADGRQLARIDAPSAINDLTLSRDGTLIISAGQDNLIRKWTLAASPTTQLATWSLAAAGQIAGHEQPATSLALVPPNGTQLLSGANDNTVRVWDIDSGRNVRTMNHGEPVNDIAVSPDGQRVVSAGRNGTAKVWQLEDGKEITTIRGDFHLARTAAQATETKVVADQLAGEADRKFAESEKNVKDREAGARKAGEARDAADKALEESRKKDAEARQSHEAAKKELDAAKQELDTAKKVVQATQKVLEAANRELETANRDSESAQKELADKPEDSELKKKVESAQRKVAEVMAKVNETRERVDATKKGAEGEAGKKVEDTRQKVDEAQRKLDEAAANLKQARDGQAAAQRGVDRANQSVEKAKKQHDRHAKAKETAVAWQTQKNTELEAAKEADGESDTAILSAAFSVDGRRVATGDAAGRVQVWGAETARAVESFSGHGAAIASVAFVGDGLLISGGNENMVVGWDLNPPWELVGRLGPESEAPLNLVPSPFIDRVLCLAFSHDGKLLATGGGDPTRNGELLIWDVAKRALVREIPDAHSDTVFGVEFSGDDRYLLSGAADKFVKLHEVETGKHVRSFEGHTHHVMDVAWQAHGLAIGSAGADSVVKVWNVETGEQLRTIEEHSKQVTAIQFIGVTDNLITSAGDGKVRHLSASTGKTIRDFDGATDYIHAAAVARDESIVIGGGEDGVLRVWNAKDTKILHMFSPPKPLREKQVNAGR